MYFTYIGSIKMNESEIVSGTSGKTVILSAAPQFVCPTHGDIGQQVLESSMVGLEMKLCLRCYIEVLQKIGVQRVIRKENEQVLDFRQK